MEVIAEESKKINDVATTSVTPVSTSFMTIFYKILSTLSIGIFKSPPFSLENIFPSVNFFKNKYFKLVSMLIIYLGLMGFILNAYKPKDTKNMIIVYSICFWIILMAFSIAIVNPYDEDSVEYMLKEKVISKMKEIVGENPDDGIKMPDGSIKMPDGSIKMPDGSIKMLDGSFQMPDGSIKMPDGSFQMPDGTIKMPDGSFKMPDGSFKMPDGSFKMPDGTIKMPDGSFKMPDGSIKMPDGSFKMPDGSIKMPDGTIIPKKQTTSTIKVPPTTSVSEEQGFLSKTIKSFF